MPVASSASVPGSGTEDGPGTIAMGTHKSPSKKKPGPQKGTCPPNADCVVINKS